MSKPKSRDALYIDDCLVADWTIDKKYRDPCLKFYSHNAIVQAHLGDYGEIKEYTENLEKLICFLEELRDKIDPDQD